jgi:hypothetical protein
MQPVLSYSDHFRLYQKIKKTLVLDDILTLLGQELTSNDKVDGFLIALADEAELSLIIEKIQLPPKYAQMNIVYNKQHYDLKKNEFICQSYLQNRIFLLDKKFEFSYDEELKTRLKRWEINSALILPLAQDFLNQGNFSSQRENNLCIDPEYIMNGFLDNIEKTTGIRNFVLAFCDQDKKTFRIHKHRFASPYENLFLRFFLICGASETALWCHFHQVTRLSGHCLPLIIRKFIIPIFDQSKQKSKFPSRY